jgi:hypothetical protein
MGEVPYVSVTNPVPFTLRRDAGSFGAPVEFLPRVGSQRAHFPGQLSVEPRQHRLQILPHAYPSALAAFHHIRHCRHVVARRLAADVQPVLSPKGNRAHSVFHPVVVHLDPPVAQNHFQSRPQVECILTRPPQQALGQRLARRLLTKARNCPKSSTLRSARSFPRPAASKPVSRAPSSTA